MKTIYKTIFTLTVLSEEPLPDDVSLSDIQYETDEGGWLLSGINNRTTELSGTEAIKEIKKAGSDISFFNLDDQGNEMEEE